VARLCVDASAVLAWLLQETNSEAAIEFWRGLRAGTDQVLAAQILLPECTSILREKAYEGLLTEEESKGLLALLQDLPLIQTPDPRQFTLALHLAGMTKRRKAYDMQYLAMAELQEAELVTLDGGLRQAAIERKVPVRFLR
jgi:predicted nucleic acid-binding protein